MFLFILLMAAAFVIPIILRKHLKYLNLGLALLWVFLIIFFIEGEIQRYSDYILIFLPLWIFGSIYALDLRSEEKADEERKFHENICHPKPKTTDIYKK